MNVVVFVGPTLPVAEARAILDATYRPPASQGDVYRAALDRPWGIAVIDGYFERMPAVWHKEILWAMTQGIHVFGASSMGALRAAELAAFGMQGVGRVFEAFHGGQLTDDDEVTVVHAEAEADYRPSSTSMVDIRATLDAARKVAVISDATHDALIAIAKRTHYAERGYRALCDRGQAEGLDVAELSALQAWLPQGAIAQKRLDALELLKVIGRARREHPGPLRPNFHFEHTNAWEQVVRRFDRRPISGGTDGDRDAELECVLDELRLDPQAHARALESALARALALEDAERRGVDVDASLLQQSLEAFRRERGLLDRARVDGWLQDQELDVGRLAVLLQADARKRVVEAARQADVRRHVVDCLRLQGAYGRLARRARAKRARLTSLGLDTAALELPLPEDELMDWYRQGLDVPLQHDADLTAHVLGYADRHAMLQALAREYIYVTARVGESSFEDVARRRPDEKEERDHAT